MGDTIDGNSFKMFVLSFFGIRKIKIIQWKFITNIQ